MAAVKQSCWREKGSNETQSKIAACSTKRKPHNPNPDEQDRPLNHAAICLKLSDDGHLEAGKRRLAGDTARAATSGEVKDLRREAQELKAVVAEQALELRLLKKSMIADGGDEE